MSFKYIEADEAPPKPMKKQTSKSAAYFREILGGLESGKVAAVEPQDGQSSRGIKVSVGRIASSMEIKVQSWSVEGSDTVYIQRED